MRNGDQDAAHVVPAAQGLQKVSNGFGGDINRDHDAVHLLVSKEAVEILRRLNLGNRVADDGDDLSESTDHFKPHFVK